MQTILRLMRSELGQLALLMMLIFAARSSLADHYHVPSGSMEYTLMSGDRVVVDKTAYGLRIPFTKIDVIATGTPQSGDVAVFDSPETGILLIKRIVAVGGDRVALIDGQLWLNGQRLATPDDGAIEHFGGQQVALNLTHGGGPSIRELVVPPGTVLAIG
ncbi:MAG: signal peptidase I, partial [Pseudomonadota bacterium]